MEFALVLPLLILFLFGIIEFGVLLYDMLWIKNAAREGARVGIVYAKERRTIEEIENEVKDYEKYLITFGSSSSNIVFDPPIVPCINSGDELKVTVKYTYDFFVLSSFLPFIELPPIPLEETVIMRCE